jgi:hypothetical protein
VKAVEPFPPAPPTKDAIVFLRDGVYRVPGGEPFSVEQCYDDVLKPFLDTPAMSKRELIDHYGYPSAPRVLKRLTEWYDRRFAPFIHLPGRRGNLGYRVSIRRE